MSGLDAVTVTCNPAVDHTLSIPNFTAGAVNRVAHERCHPGGKGVNVAAALADAGHRVAVTGFLGRDNAAPFTAMFAAHGIADAFVRLDGATRTGIKIADPARHLTTDINFPGLSPSAADLAELSARLDRLYARIVVLAGSLPPGVEPAFYGQLTEALVGRGRRVVVDTSGEPLRKALAARPHVVKPNQHELETLLGRPLDGLAAIIAAARELIAGGVEEVVVSMGKDGACFVGRGDVVVARPPAVTVASTVGAGDAMVAGLVAAELEGLDRRDRARRATAFALDALTRIEPGLTSAAAVEAAMRTVQIEVLSA